MRRTCSRWRRPMISSQSRHSLRTVRTNRSAHAFACGACTGVWITLIPSLRNTSSKAAVNLLSRSWIRKRIRSRRSVKRRLRACWTTQAPDGFEGAPGKVNAPAAELDEEEHVEAAQRDRLDREEV